jgi:hypothetical protein
MGYPARMRWHIVFMMAAGVSDCWGTPTSGGSGAGTTGAGGATTTTGGGGAPCASSAACNGDCVACALNGPCATLYNNCLNSADCSTIDQCFALCGADTACRAQCYADTPTGAADYRAVNQCVYCQQCAKQCPGQCQ